jgi:hypothetical protein
MAEFPRAKPTTLEALHWADVAPATPPVEPAEGLKDAGYAVNAKPAAVAWNWREREIGKLAQWVGAMPRRFATLAEGIAATSPGDLFAVEPANGLALARGANWLSIPATPLAWCTDGWQVYEGTSNVVTAYHAGTGVEEWSVDLGGANIQQMCCDGGRVFAACSDGGTGITIYMLSSATGAEIDTITVSPWDLTNCPLALAANGTRLLLGGQNATQTGVTVCEYTESAISVGFTAVHGAVAGTQWVESVAIFNAWFIYSAKANESGRIMVKVSFGAAVLGAVETTSWGPVPRFKQLSTDGDRIYASGSAGLFGALAQARQWEFSSYLESAAAGCPYSQEPSDYGADINGAGVIGPGVRAMNPAAAAGVFVYDHDWRLVAFLGVDRSLVPSSFDGLNLWVYDTTGTDNLRAYALNLAPRLFRRASSLDVNRRAVGMLAQPVR